MEGAEQHTACWSELTKTAVGRSATHVAQSGPPLDQKHSHPRAEGDPATKAGEADWNADQREVRHRYGRNVPLSEVSTG